MNKAFLAVLLALAAIVTMTSYTHAAAVDLLDAVKAGDIAAVRRLLEQGANVNARDENRETPLHHAAYRGKTEVAALLIQKGAKVNARDVYEETPLHHAAYWGKTEVAALLIQK
ncbi:MAG: ankyrin repeat domain-containing protein, partial [Syntrophobacteraceae bacterium]